MNSYCVRCLVSGRVQGVFFRAATRLKAQELAVNGWARNLPDGRVEVLACGEEASVKLFRDWLWVGPPAADVIDVVCEVVDVQDVQGFSIA